MTRVRKGPDRGRSWTVVPAGQRPSPPLDSASTPVSCWEGLPSGQAVPSLKYTPRELTAGGSLSGASSKGDLHLCGHHRAPAALPEVKSKLQCPPVIWPLVKPGTVGGHRCRAIGACSMTVRVPGGRGTVRVDPKPEGASKFQLDSPTQSL